MQGSGLNREQLAVRACSFALDEEGTPEKGLAGTACYLTASGSFSALSCFHRHGDGACNSFILLVAKVSALLSSEAAEENI